MKKNTKYLTIFVLALCIVINYGCPSIFGYNIIGTWSVAATYALGGTDNWTVSFVGDKKSGTVTLSGYGTSLTGTFEVDGKNIDFDVSASDGIISFAGTISNNEEMNGTGTVLFYSDASGFLSNLMKRHARTAAQSVSFAFDWVGTKN